MTLTIPTIRLTGTLLDATGHPVRQYVTLTPSFSVLRDVGDLSTIIPSRVQVLPDNVGHFAVDLLATNYPGVDPAHWAWRMVIPGGPTYNIPLDYATPGGTLDLIDILSATSAATSTTVVWDRRIADSIDYDKTVAPTDGQAVVWNAASGKFKPGPTPSFDITAYGAVGSNATADTAALTAAFAAAAAVQKTTQPASNNDATTLPVRPTVHIPDGEWWINAQQTIPQGVNLVMGDHAKLKATASMVSILRTDPAVLHESERWVGGILDCNALAQSAFIVGCAIACDLHLTEIFNPTQHGIILGDPAASQVSYELDVKLRRAWRPRGTTPPSGYAALWVQSCTDSVVEIGSVRGFDIGTKNDGGNMEFRTIHPWNPTGAAGPTTCHDEGSTTSGTRLMGYVFDSPGTYGLRVRGAGSITLVAPQFYLNSGVTDNTVIAIQCDGSPQLNMLGGAIYSANSSHRWKNDIVVVGSSTKIRWLTYSDSSTVVTRNWGDRFFAAGMFFNSGGVVPLQVAAGSVDAFQLFISGTKAAAITKDGGFTSGNATTAGATTYSGSGAPSSGLGANGDYYFRTDTPTTANQRLYVKSAGAWSGIL